LPRRPTKERLGSSQWRSWRRRFSRRTICSSLAPSPLWSLRLHLELQRSMGSTTKKLI